MKQIVTYCKETEEKTQTRITEIKATLKQQLKRNDYTEIQNIKLSKTGGKADLVPTEILKV